MKNHALKMREDFALKHTVRMTEFRICDLDLWFQSHAGDLNSSFKSTDKGNHCAICEYKRSKEDFALRTKPTDRQLDRRTGPIQD